MKQFMDENFLLQSETAQKLYHSYAADAPDLRLSLPHQPAGNLRGSSVGKYHPGMARRRPL